MDCKITNAKNVMEANHEDQGYIIKDGIIVLCKVRAEQRLRLPLRTGSARPLWLPRRVR